VTKQQEARRGELNGVPVFWADAGDPFAAALVFRVGRADETLPTGGVTHLVEHLALSAVGHTSFAYDAFVEPARTVFFAEGSEEEVSGFLRAVSSALANLPLERLETERRILKTEVASFQPGPIEGLMALRFGPVGYGLVGYDQFGLNRLQAREVQDWAHDRFTAGSAALWTTRPPPAGLRLGLPSGPLAPPPTPEPIANLRLPAYFAQGSGGVAVSLLAPRSPAAGAARRIAEERARRALRHERGLAYEVGAAFEALTTDVAHVTFFADCLDAHANAARDGMLEVLDEIAERGPTREELENDLETMRRQLSNPWETAGWLDYCVHEELLGARRPSKEETLHEIEAVTPDAAAEALAGSLETLLLLVPEHLDAHESRFHAYPLWSRNSVDGRAVRPKGIAGWLSRDHIIIGREGISLVSGDGNMSTVLFGECVGVLRSPSGKHVLFGRDGVTVGFDPAELRDGNAVVAAVEAGIPEDRFIPVDESEIVPAGEPTRR
jgi:hypothetical protein